MPMAQRSRHRAPTLADAAEMARESDHRIANNLQLLMAMIAPERHEVDDPHAGLMLARMLGRIGAIAGVHRQFTRPQKHGRVDVGGYLATLAADRERLLRRGRRPPAAGGLGHRDGAREAGRCDRPDRVRMLA
jgi:two-component sensor histidine kinase